MHGELDVARLEPGDEPHGHQVLPHRVDERAAELSVAPERAQRPPHRVDDPLERLRDAPDLLHAERPDLRVRAVEVEAVDGRAREQALRALREHGHLRDDVRARLEGRQRLTVAAAPLVARARADDAAVLDEELRGRGLRQHGDAERLGLLAEEAAELGRGQDVVPVVPHRRGRRDPVRGTARHDVDRLAGHLPVGREVGHRQPVAEELAQRARADDGAGDEVRPRLLPLLEHRDRDLAEALAHLRVLLEELAEPDRAREPAGAAADDEHADVDPRLGRVGGHADRVDRAVRRREVGRPSHRDGRARARSAWGRSGAGRRRRRSRRSRRWARSGPC